jgi:tetratricopeptide (TPR) repeat protein
MALLVADQSVDAKYVDELLAAPAPEQRTSLLRSANLLNAEGLDRLLDFADRLVYSDPGKAQRLAELCAGLADAARAPAAIPHANYVLAGVHSANGEFEEDLRLTKAAHDGYAVLGMNLEALRTNVGKMAALLELGRYREALDAGQVVLDAVNGKSKLQVTPTRQQADLLTALVQQNRGGCLEYMGRYDEALEAYAIAEERYQTLGMTERIGQVRSDRGAILLSLGRGREALAAQEAAAAIFSVADLTLSQAKVLGNIGETHLQLANYARSLKTFEQARRLLISVDALAEECFLLRSTADAYLALNLHSEALASYREANGLLRSLGMDHDRARALWGMGSALIALSELEKAEEALTEAARLFAAAGNVPMLSGVMLEQASLLEARPNHEAALAMASRALELVSEDAWPVQQVYARLRLADLLLPDTAAAEPHLLAARGPAERLALPQLRYRLNERLGHLRRLQGRDEEARRMLEAAVDEIEHLRGAVAQDAMRASFLQDKTAAYEDLLLLHLARNDEESARRAFAVAERAKSRALTDLLTGVVKEPGTIADDATERRIHDLQSELNVVYTRMLDDTDEGKHETPFQGLRGRAVELEREITQLRLRTAAATADPFAPPAASDSSEHLPSDETLLAYHIVGDEIMGFVNAQDGVLRAVRHLGSAATVAGLVQQLDLQWDRFGAHKEFVERHGALLERLTRQVLASLYGELVRPLEPHLNEAASTASKGTGAPRRLAIVPHGLLHRVPFHALFDGERYLLERFEISYAPSAKVYSLCQQRFSRGLDKALALSVVDPSIPAVTEEVQAVARHLPHAEVLSDERATMEALRTKAPDCDVLHLACHGMFRSDNPMFSSLKLQDGWLTAADVLHLDLEGALVTLSACESGRSEVFAGDELIGLTRAFLRAGAATLVASLWVVQDATTVSLMDKWYEHLRKGVGRAAALRNAQLALREKYPHPYYWAPFVLIGQR